MLRVIVASSLLACVCAGLCQSDDSKSKASADATFEKIKKMVGTWVEADKDGKPTDKVISVVRMTAGGSAVHETLFPGDAMEMVSVYHKDKDDVVMTHYCMLGNQPRMKADLSSPANKIRWVFAGGTNLDPSKDAHMHGAVVTIIDEDHVQIEGESWEGGKPSAENCGTLKLVRKK